MIVSRSNQNYISFWKGIAVPEFDTSQGLTSQNSYSHLPHHGGYHQYHFIPPELPLQ